MTAVIYLFIHSFIYFSKQSYNKNQSVDKTLKYFIDVNEYVSNFIYFLGFCLENM